MKARKAEIISLIHKEVKPALGCTEPIAVALAVAKAVEVMQEATLDDKWRSRMCYKLSVEVSGNILKNGMGVGIPGTGMVGLHIAAALGAVCGRSSYGLEVLHDLDDDSVERAKSFVKNESVVVSLADTDLKLYVKASVEYDGHVSYAVIQNDHDNIVETGFDGAVVTMDSKMTVETISEQKTTLDYGLSVKEILEFASAPAVMALSEADATSGIQSAENTISFCSKLDRKKLCL